MGKGSMEKLELVIGNKAYSSWSLRPWLVLKEIGAEFVETRVPLYVHGYKEELLKHAPSGKVPILKHGSVTVWNPWPSANTSPSSTPRPGSGPRSLRHAPWRAR